MKFDPMQIFFYLIRVIPVIVVIILVAYVFFSFRVEVHTQEMDRLNIELAENILVSDMVVAKSVFDAKKLLEIVKNENLEKQKYDKYGLQPNPRICGYGYSISIDGQEEFYCEKSDDCILLCMNMCGLSEADITASNYRCHRQGLFGILGSKRCDCNCDPAKDDWQDRYKYYFGYKPGFTEIKNNQRQYPVAIYEDEFRGFHHGSASPAFMSITLYDSWVTRISCMAERAYDLKEIQKMNVYDFSKFGTGIPGFRLYNSVGLKKFDTNHLCMFGLKGGGSQAWEYGERDCVYSEVPVVLFFDGYIKGKYYHDVRAENVTLVAYPIKQSALGSAIITYDQGPIPPLDLAGNSDLNCKRVNGNIAKGTDVVGGVLFCLETEEKDRFPPP